MCSEYGRLFEYGIFWRGERIMKDLLFGWFLKPEIQLTPLEKLISAIEISIVIVLIFLIYQYINEKRGK